MRIFFILILFITFKVHAATFLFGHENIKLGMDKDKALKLIKEKNSHEFLTAQIIEDSTIYLIGGLEFNREITFLYEKVKEIQLHTMVEYKNISSIEDDLDKIMYLFDEKANFLGAQNNKNEVIIIEGSEKTYRQKQIYEDELGVEYKSSEKCILNNEFKDVTRKYEFENSNISMTHTVGNCWNRNDLFYLDITIYYWIDGMDIYMKEYLKDNPPKKIIKKSNF